MNHHYRSTHAAVNRDSALAFNVARRRRIASRKILLLDVQLAARGVVEKPSGVLGCQAVPVSHHVVRPATVLTQPSRLDDLVIGE